MTTVRWIATRSIGALVVVALFLCSANNHAPLDGAVHSTPLRNLVLVFKCGAAEVPERATVITGVAAAAIDDGWEVSWRAQLPGDYDQSGKVTIADLTPLARHFGEDVEGSEALSVLDYDGNFIVNIAEVTAVGAFFNVSLDGFEVAWSDCRTGPFTKVASLPFVAHTVPVIGPFSYSTTVQLPPEAAHLSIRVLVSNDYGLYTSEQMELTQ